MNKTTLIRLGIFVLGAGVGFLVGKKMYEEYYANIAQEEINSVKERFETRPKYDDRGDTAIAADTKQELGFRSVPNHLSRSSLDDNPCEKAKRNYHLASTVAEAEAHPDTDEEDDDDEERDAAGMTEREINPDIDRTYPYVIEADDFKDEFDQHDKQTLYYYRYDDVLSEEDESIIKDIDGTIGDDALAKLDMQTTVWVRNEPLAIDYEIIALNSSYADTIGKARARNALAMSPREQYAAKQKLQNRKKDDE